MPNKHQLLGLCTIAAGALFGITGFAPMQATPGACRGPDTFSSFQITHLQTVMQSANPLDSAFLQRVHLPRVAASTIQLVTNDSLCSRAVQAWTAMDTITTPPLTSLYVIQVGSVYDVVDPQTSGAEWSQHLVLDTSFQPVAPYLF